MAERKNWDQICATAEKLRASDEKKWTWGNIAAEFGVTEGNLYYQVSKRREANGTPNKRVGALKTPQREKSHHHNLKTLRKRNLNRQS
ncbi:hypothetical protein [Bacillus wiedmannii]|uniref:hypothetical protein n=1 Tax=Bacillus wiedmannii TaxID=1890302 RepID=UPI0020CC5F7C